MAIKAVRIPIVFAMDANYILPVAVAMHSLLLNSDADKKYDFYLLTDKESDANGKKYFETLCGKYGHCNIKFIRMEEILFNEVEIHSDYITKATMYRLILPDILQNVDKCIYLDGDILVYRDISELIDIDVEKCYVAGVIDSEMSKSMRHKNYLGIPDIQGYVNAGVLVMNLKKMREDKMCGRFVEEMKKNYLFGDQDIINKLCYGKIKKIDDKYNSFAVDTARNNKADVIVHFAGGEDVKPWINRKSRLSMEWWKYADIFKGTKEYDSFQYKKAQYEQRKDWIKIRNAAEKANEVYIWGYTQFGRTVAEALIYNGIATVTAFLDNDKSKQGSSYKNIKVISPEKILEDLKDDSLIINTVQRRRKEIEYYLAENHSDAAQILHYTPKTSQFYRVLDPKYYLEEFEELVLFSKGVYIKQ